MNRVELERKLKQIKQYNEEIAQISDATTALAKMTDSEMKTDIATRKDEELQRKIEASNKILDEILKGL
ncbi:hypothetical protein ACP7OL_000558 [Salmonella enterica subsp. enterica]